LPLLLNVRELDRDPTGLQKRWFIVLAGYISACAPPLLKIHLWFSMFLLLTLLHMNYETMEVS
jgi:hypothetical protein